MIFSRSYFVFFMLFLGTYGYSQRDFYASKKVTRADTLRGKLRAERTCYDVGHYDLSLELDISNQSISGHNLMTYRILQDFQRLQVDLFVNMVIDSIVHKGQTLSYERIDAAVFVQFPKTQQVKDSVGAIDIFYHGSPHVAKNPPWDGGFSWIQDDFGRDMVMVSCEGIGASLWWPNKDHLSDEPDSVDIRLVVPDTLIAVSNGRLIEQKKLVNARSLFHWHVANPINNYNVTLNVGHYAHFHEYYVSTDGDSLDLDYYVLPENLAKAKKHFKMVPEMLSVYEGYLGKYPFWEDGYALVETPTLGMEHQGAISYGNQYKRGYLGGRILKGMNWDYIIVHESGHEYWGNSVSCNDLAEMWLHEGFTTYMEALYVEKLYGYDISVAYLLTQKRNIWNHSPIIGPMDVDFKPMFSTDQYYKGSWILHTLRNAIGNDVLWFEIFRGFYEAHALSNVTTQDFITYVNTKTGDDYSAFFEQYLYYSTPPKLVYRLKKKRKKLIVEYRWDADIEDFNMPIRLGHSDHFERVRPNTKEWQSINLGKMKIKEFRIDFSGFYVLDKRERG